MPSTCIALPPLLSARVESWRAFCHAHPAVDGIKEFLEDDSFSTPHRAVKLHLAALGRQHSGRPTAGKPLVEPPMAGLIINVAIAVLELLKALIDALGGDDT